MTDPPLFLSLVNLGTPTLPRWCVCDQYLRYFNGKNFVPDKSKALLFASNIEAGLESEAILQRRYEHLGRSSFVAPCVVDLFSDRPLSLSVVKNWIWRNAVLTVDPPKYGVGPVDGSLGLVGIEWAGLKMIKNWKEVKE